MKLFFVSVKPVDVTKDVTEDVIRAALGRTFDGKATEEAGIFLTEADAAEWANYGIKGGEKNSKQHAVVTLDTNLTKEQVEKFEKITDGEDAPAVCDAKGKLIKLIDCYSIPANNFTVEKASLSHVKGCEVKDVAFAAPVAAAPVATDAAAPVATDAAAPAATDAAAPAAPAAPAATDAAAPAATDANKATKASAALDLIKKLATPVLSAGAIGTAFWYQGLVPAAVAALSKVGLVLPAASLATQIAIPAAVGLLAYAAGTASWMAAKAGYNLVSAAWKKFNRTNKEKYDDELAANTAEIQAIETALKLDNTSFVVKLADKMKAAPEPKFDDKGALAEDSPKEGNRGSLVLWQLDQMRAIAKVEEAKRAEMLAEVLNGPKPAAPKA